MGTVIVSPVQTPLPQDPKEAVAHLHERVRELNELVLDMVNSFSYETHVEPIRPRDGMIRREGKLSDHPFVPVFASSILAAL